MFCPDCGTQCQSNFCPNCGKDLNGVEIKKTIPPLSEPYYYERNGKRVDLHKIMRASSGSWGKIGACSQLVLEFGITRREAKEILEPLYAAHAGEKVTFGQSVKAAFSLTAEQQRNEQLEEKQKRKALEESGAVYCPKCMSTSVTAVKKGFSAVPAILTGNVLVGAIGANKIKCVCLKCGYKWKP